MFGGFSQRVKKLISAAEQKYIDFDKEIFLSAVDNDEDYRYTHDDLKCIHRLLQYYRLSKFDLRVDNIYKSEHPNQDALDIANTQIDDILRVLAHLLSAFDRRVYYRHLKDVFVRGKPEEIFTFINRSIITSLNTLEFNIELKRDEMLTRRIEYRGDSLRVHNAIQKTCIALKNGFGESSRYPLVEFILLMIELGALKTNSKLKSILSQLGVLNNKMETYGKVLYNSEFNDVFAEISSFIDKHSMDSITVQTFEEEPEHDDE